MRQPMRPTRIWGGRRQFQRTAEPRHARNFWRGCSRRHGTRACAWGTRQRAASESSHAAHASFGGPKISPIYKCFRPERKVWDPKVMPMGIVDGQEVCGWCLQFIDRTVNPNTLQRPGNLARVSGEDRGCTRSKRERERWFVSSKYREATQTGGCF